MEEESKEKIPNALTPDWKVSASQVKQFLSCEKKWFYQYILGKKSEPGPHLQFGSNCHIEVEHYLQTGTIRESDYSVHVDMVTEYLPSPGEGLLVEHDFCIDTFPGGPPWRGYIDCLDIRNHREIPLVSDLKTAKDLKYSKTQKELIKDPQMISYAKATQIITGWTKEIELAHVYVTRDFPPKSKRVSTLITPEKVAEEWAKLLEIVKQMKQLRDQALAGLSERDLKGNLEACLRPFPCDYAQECSSLKSNGAIWNVVTAEKETLKEKTGEDVVEKLPVVKTIAEKKPSKPLEPEVNPVAESKKGLQTLYVDCVPLKGGGSYVLLEDWLIPFAKEASNRLAVQDYRLVDYGKGKVVLLQVIRENLESLPPIMVARSMGNNEIISELVSHARRVIAGLK